MKKMPYVAMLCLPLLGQAQTAQVHIAGVDYPVMFVDTNLSLEVKQRIASDLKIVFSSVPSFEKARGREAESGVFKLRRFGLVIPHDERREGIFVIDKDNQRCISLNEFASSNYVAAFTLVDAHSNAVQKARAFAATVKNTDWSTKPLQALKDLHHMTPEDREEYPEEAYLDFIKELQQSTFLEFSALTFSLRQCPEADNQTILGTGLYTLDGTDLADGVFGFPILFYKGKWGFGKYWAGE